MRRYEKLRFRELNWLFVRAQHCVQTQEDGPSRADDGPKIYSWLRDTIAMLQDISDNPTDNSGLERRHEALYEAYLHHTLPSRGLLRQGLELALTAGVDNQRIFDELGMDDDTIEAYSTVFYNIRPCLKHPLLARAHLLSGLDEHSRLPLPRLYKLVAYYRGLDAAQFVMTGFSSVDHVTKEGLIAAISDDVVEALKRQALVAAMTFNTGGHGSTEIIHAFVKNREVETKENLNDQATDHLQEGLDALIKSLKNRVTIGGHAPETGQPVPRLPQLIDNTAVELPQSAIGHVPVMRRLASAGYPNMVAAST